MTFPDVTIFHCIHDQSLAMCPISMCNYYTPLRFLKIGLWSICWSSLLEQGREPCDALPRP